MTETRAVMKPTKGAGTDNVSGLLRDAIRKGRFMPNQRLVEQELAEYFNVNRAKVRTALAVLNQEGLVSLEPNRGARVRVVTPTEAVEIAQARGVLEGMVAAQAAERATEADRKRLRDILHRMEAALEASDLLLYSEINGDLHAAIQDIAGNATAKALLTGLKSRIVRLQFRVILMPGRPLQSMQEHREIVERICAGDAEGADRAMRRHLTVVIDSLKRAIEQQDQIGNFE